MLTERPGPATVYVCFLCLLSLMHQPAEQISTRGILRKVESFINIAPLKLLDCKLYTPNATDYKNCPRTTIECFADELGVLIEEWEIVKNVSVYKLNVKLKRLAEDITQVQMTNSVCLQCELLKEKEAAMFLTDLATTLKMMMDTPGNS